MIVDDGVVSTLNVEESILACDATGADTLLAQV
jgi:peroxiredoxin